MVENFTSDGPPDIGLLYLLQHKDSFLERHSLKKVLRRKYACNKSINNNFRTEF